MPDTVVGANSCRSARYLATLWLAAVMLPIFFGGCCQWQSGLRTPCLLHRRARQELAVYRKWAHDAVDCEAVSESYREGFVTGFVDHVFAGGRGQPPLVPPTHYWGALRQQDREDWRLGFRAGADVAMAGGYVERALFRRPLGAAAAITYASRDGTPSWPTAAAPSSMPLMSPVHPLANDSQDSTKEPESIDFSGPQFEVERGNDDAAAQGRPARLDPELVVDEEAFSQDGGLPLPEERPIEIDDWSKDPFADDPASTTGRGLPPLEPGSATNVDVLDRNPPELRDQQEHDSPLEDDLVPSASNRDLFPSPPLSKSERSPSDGVPPGATISFAETNKGTATAGHYSELIRASETASGRAFVDSIANVSVDAAASGQPASGRTVSYEQPVEQQTRMPRARPSVRRRTTGDIMRLSGTMFRDLDHVEDR